MKKFMTFLTVLATLSLSSGHVFAQTEPAGSSNIQGDILRIYRLCQKQKALTQRDKENEKSYHKFLLTGMAVTFISVGSFYMWEAMMVSLGGNVAAGDPVTKGLSGSSAPITATSLAGMTFTVGNAAATQMFNVVFNDNDFKALIAEALTDSPGQMVARVEQACTDHYQQKREFQKATQCDQIAAQLLDQIARGNICDADLTFQQSNPY